MTNETITLIVVVVVTVIIAFIAWSLCKVCSGADDYYNELYGEGKMTMKNKSKNKPRMPPMPKKDKGC
jgi:hypothetical protein